jgi:hypothetical protein
MSGPPESRVMKKSYGVKSLLIVSGIYITIVGWVLFVFFKLGPRPGDAAHIPIGVYIFYTLLAAVLMLLLYGFVSVFLRYNFVEIEDGVIVLGSLNPFYKRIAITLWSVGSISFFTGRSKNVFTVVTANDEMKIPISVGVPEVKNLFQEIMDTAPHIQLSGPWTNPELSSIDKKESRSYR